MSTASLPHVAQQGVTLFPSYQAPFGADGARGEDGIGGMDSASEDPNSDFAQTFYDPFRIKHRRRTSPAQLKILEDHFGRNPKPDVNLRKQLSEQLDMTPREVQVWHGFGTDYNLGRRGSSPAILTAGQRYDGYDSGPPVHHGYNTHDRPPYQPPPHAVHSIYQSSPHPHSGLSTPASSNDLIGDYHQVSAATRASAFDDAPPHARRYSLPAQSLHHPLPSAPWKAAEDLRFAGGGHPFGSGPPYAQNPNVYSPPLEYANPGGDRDFGSSNGSGAGLSPDFGFGAIRDEGSPGRDYSPSSSGDEQPHFDQPAGQPGDSNGLGQYSFGQRWNPDPEDRPTPSTPDTMGYAAAHLSPLGLSPGSRRASCPAEFQQGFDNLGLSSPSQATPGWSPAYTPSFNGGAQHQQPHPALSLPPLNVNPLQKRHSFAAPYPHTPSNGNGPAYSPSSNGGGGGGGALYAPHAVNPITQNPQFLQHSGRRGSTSSVLGTIAEQPSGLAQFAAEDSLPPAGGVARKSRSQASLRATPPYPTTQDRQERSERRSPLLQERRGSVSGGDAYYPAPA
ncbi:hypothetical protein RQP46_006747 [Phenoliferia psychrophenolica]